MNLLDRLESPFFWAPLTCFWSGGDSNASSTESGEKNFTTTLQNAFGQQFAQQQATLNFLNGKMTSMVNNPQGYDAATLGAMRTSATDTVAQQFQNAKIANQNAQFGRGSENMPSGVNAQINAALTSQGAQAEAGAQNQITQQNGQLKQQNFWNATNALNGVAQEYNPTGFASSANNAAGEVAGLSSAITAANGPTFGSILGGAVTGATSALTSAYCPAEGSMYLLADSAHLPVELLTVGDKLMGIDDEAQTIEEIQSVYANVLRVATENGCILRNSYTHSYALPKGGFTAASRSWGKIISTATGPSKVISVEQAGQAWVFNVITDGSHTYCADGVWALGVGDDERHVGVNEWAEASHV